MMSFKAVRSNVDLNGQYPQSLVKCQFPKTGARARARARQSPGSMCMPLGQHVCAYN